ncbi:hypothetical protein ROZALSC1DRAFT_27840, partial [Rozella allomycis CSF55]
LICFASSFINSLMAGIEFTIPRGIVNKTEFINNYIFTFATVVYFTAKATHYVSYKANKNDHQQTKGGDYASKKHLKH